MDVPEVRTPLQASKGLAEWHSAERPFDTCAGGSSMMPKRAAFEGDGNLVNCVKKRRHLFYLVPSLHYP